MARDIRRARSSRSDAGLRVPPVRIVLNPIKSQFHLSRGVQVGNLLFLAGHVAREDGTGDVKGDISQQTAEILRQFDATLAMAGASLQNLVKVTAYLTRRSDYAEFNAAYARFFPGEPPVRTTIVAQLLPPGSLVEMDGIACL